MKFGRRNFPCSERGSSRIYCGNFKPLSTSIDRGNRKIVSIVETLSAPIAKLVEHPLSEREAWVRTRVAPYQMCKTDTSSSLADARIKWVVLGR